MIFLRVENYCQNCSEFEPRCSRLARLGEYDTFIECEHEDRCRMMKKYIEEQQIICKDCKHNANSPEAGNAKCDLFYGMTEQYGFCHKAERRMNDGYSSVPC